MVASSQDFGFNSPCRLIFHPMKLRLRDNSLRFRLDRLEVAALGGTGLAESRTAVSAELPLVYRIRLSRDTDQPDVSFDQGTITVRVPEDLGRRWAESDDVGIYATTPWGLRLTIEKDFRCLDAGARDEDESQSYDHPGATTGQAC